VRVRIEGIEVGLPQTQAKEVWNPSSPN